MSEKHFVVSLARNLSTCDETRLVEKLKTIADEIEMDAEWGYFKGKLLGVPFKKTRHSSVVGPCFEIFLLDSNIEGCGCWDVVQQLEKFEAAIGIKLQVYAYIWYDGTDRP